jgi:hypothetical protein
MNWPSSTGEQETAELPRTDVGLARTPGIQAAAKVPMAAAAQERCPMCSAATAADQRYCVQCGQRLGRARPLFMQNAGSVASSGAGSPATPPPSRPRFRMSPNSTLIAGIGTLLLAMGVGVLIGHLGRNPSSSHVSTPILTIPSTGAAGTATTPAATSSTANSPTSSSKSATPGATKAASKPSKTATPPPSPAVKVGQKGSGKGYQHHKFTGHFFGGENEEEAGEESEAGKTSKSKSGSTGKGKK